MFYRRGLKDVDAEKYRLVYADENWSLWRKREANGDWSTFRLVRPGSKVKKSFWLGWNRVGQRFAEQNDFWVLRTFHPEMEGWLRKVATIGVEGAGPAPASDASGLSPIDRSFPLAQAVKTLEMIDAAFGNGAPLGLHGSLPPERRLPAIMAERFKMKEKMASIKIKRLIEMGVLKKKKVSTKTGVTGLYVDWVVWESLPKGD
jgi:hypothetical protein